MNPDSKAAAAPREAKVLSIYLLAALPLVAHELSSAAARGGAQVHILGMTDLLSQIHKWSADQYFVAYRNALHACELVPNLSIPEFVKRIAVLAETNEAIEKTMRVAAQSIRLFVAERDPNAPIDLAQAILFAKKHAATFQMIGEC